MARHVEVEDVADAWHIQAAGGDVRGHKDAQIAFAKGIQCAGALCLIEVAMDCGRIISIFFQGLSCDVYIDFTVAKDDGVGERNTFPVDQLPQDLALFTGGTIVPRAPEIQDFLFNRLTCGRLAGHFHFGRRGQERVGDPLNFRCHGGREKQRLPRKGGQAENSFNIGDKAHVQHTVGFIDDHDLNAGQQQLATLEVIQ